jgi:hypothetical protein
MLALNSSLLNRDSHNGSWSSLYSLGTDRIENTAFNKSSTVARVSVVAIT